MTKRQYEEWVKPMLGTPSPTKRLFMEAVALADAAKDPGRHFIEGSFNSADGERVLRLIHIFSLERERLPKAEAGGRFIDRRPIERYMKAVNARLGCEFDLDILDILFSTSLSHGKTPNDFLGFSLDFDRETASLGKATVFLNPARPRAAVRLSKALGMRRPPPLERLLREGPPDFLGVDLYPNARWRLKLYARGAARGLRPSPAQEKLLARMERLKFDKPLFKTSIASSGLIESSDPNWAVSGRGVSCPGLCERLGLEAYRDFVDRMKPLLEGKQIRWLSLKRDKGLELYFAADRG